MEIRFKRYFGCWKLKSRVNITCCFFVPLLEVIFEDKIRKPLGFLKTSEKICTKLEQLYYKKKEKHKKEDIRDYNNLVFVPKVGKINVSFTTESYNYYRLTRVDICNKEPIRPLIALTSAYRKWKMKEIDFKINNGRKRAEIYLSLAGSIKKKVSLEIHKRADNVEEKINQIIKLCNNKKPSEKKDLLDSVYTDYSNIHVRESDLLTIIEMNQNIQQMLNFDISSKKYLLLDDMKIVFLDFNKILLINIKNHSKLFIERIAQIITLVFFLKVLANRANEILDKNIFVDKHLEQKFEFYEYILAVLNPIVYSTVDNLKILSNHYQRVLFTEAAQKLSLFKYTKRLEEKLIQKIKSWELREQVKFLSRDNKIINRLKLKYKLEREQIIEPALTEKERIILGYLLDKYKSSIDNLGIVGKKLQTPTPPGSVSRNEIRKEIKAWMRKTNSDPTIITDNELKEHVPKPLVGLINKGLVVKNPVKGRITFLFYLNEKDNYIQTRLRGL